MRLWDNVGVDQVPDVEKTWEGEHALGSQLGSLVMIGDARCMDNVENPGCIVYWRSKASTRVCRSTFTGDMMACGDALERALFIRGLLVSLRDGDLLSEREAGGRIPLHLFTDCKSLYDHLHREGVPRPPSEKRLAIELTAIKHPIHWLPTDKQWADVLTKKMTSTMWWQNIGEGLISFPLVVPNQSLKTGDAGSV